jgi:1-acyl-sn-glycerol-3-phosphate acyltransferase
MTEATTPSSPADWRDNFTWYTRETMVCRVIKLIGGLYFRSVAAVECVDFDHIPATGPCIVASNHVSNLDVSYLALYLPRHPYFMAKVELYQNPIFAWGIRMCGSFPVYRGENDAWALQQAGRVLTAGQLLCMFPEGTRSKGKAQLRRGKVGAVKLALDYQVPLIPVAVTGTHDFRWRGWRGHKIVIQAGPSLDLAALAGSTSYQPETLRELTTLLMRQIAAMLPLALRGIYA